MRGRPSLGCCKTSGVRVTACPSEHKWWAGRPRQARHLGATRAPLALAQHLLIVYDSPNTGQLAGVACVAASDGYGLNGYTWMKIPGASEACQWAWLQQVKSSTCMRHASLVEDGNRGTLRLPGPTTVFARQVCNGTRAGVQNRGPRPVCQLQGGHDLPHQASSKTWIWIGAWERGGPFLGNWTPAEAQADEAQPDKAWPKM